jgi:phosphoribosylamine-glycine ligase
MAHICKDAGAEVHTYLTRDYGHYGAGLCGPTYVAKQHPSLMALFDKFSPDLVIPMSIDWRNQPWAPELLARSVPILSPRGEAMEIEVSREFATQLCAQHGIPTPQSFHARNRLEAEQILREQPRPYVLKNPICSPFSPVHTIVCETVEETRGWLKRLDYAEGVFLQEYLGTAEAGHFVFVSNGEIYSQVTNQEYKRAFVGNMGPVAGAPLGGIVEQDPNDRYGIARELIHPLLPWLRKCNFHGPLQVTAMRRAGQWVPIEYNVRLGVTSGALWLKMLSNLLETLIGVAWNQPLAPSWKHSEQIGASVTLAGYGYPYIVNDVPKLPVLKSEQLDCDLWWNEVYEQAGSLFMTSHSGLDKGHRIADVNALAPSLSEALDAVYRNLHRLHCLNSYYRTDIGQTLWPPL